VDQLPPQCQAVLALKVFHGYFYREIGERLRLAEKTVEQGGERARPKGQTSNPFEAGRLFAVLTECAKYLNPHVHGPAGCTGARRWSKRLRRGRFQSFDETLTHVLGIVVRDRVRAYKLLIR
jgi:hypothetical protein